MQYSRLSIISRRRMLDTRLLLCAWIGIFVLGPGVSLVKGFGAIALSFFRKRLVLKEIVW